MGTNRRQFIRTVGAKATGVSLAAGNLKAQPRSGTKSHKKDDDGPVLFIGDNITLREEHEKAMKPFFENLGWVRGKRLYVEDNESSLVTRIQG